MKKLTKTCLCIAAAVTVLTAFWVGFGLGLAEQEPEPVEKNVTVIEPVSEGVRAGEVYTTEIWDNGEVRIVTTQGYINQLSERTILITDRNLDEVQEEISDMMDIPEEQR